MNNYKLGGCGDGGTCSCSDKKLIGGDGGCGSCGIVGGEGSCGCG